MSLASFGFVLMGLFLNGIAGSTLPPERHSNAIKAQQAPAAVERNHGSSEEIETVTNYTSQYIPLSHGDPKNILAVGRRAELGELYDARTDRFLGRTILASDYPKSLIAINPTNVQETHIVGSESYHGKFKGLNVDPELQFSILAETFPVTHSGRYFFQKNRRHVKSMVYTNSLQVEELILSDPAFKESLQLDALNQQNPIQATHYVAKIERGVNSIFSLQADCGSKLVNHTQNLKNTIAHFKRGEDGNGRSSTDLSALLGSLTELNQPDLLKISVYADTHEKPFVIESTQDLLNFLEETIIGKSQLPGQKGQPITYRLLPLENLQGLTRPVVQYQAVFSPTQDPSPFSVFFNNIDVASSQIDQLSSDVERYVEYSSDDDIATMKGVEEEFRNVSNGFKSEFREIIKQIREGRPGASLDALLLKYPASKYFEQNHRFKPLRKMSLFEEKLKLYKGLKGTNVKFVGRGNKISLNQIFTERNPQNQRIFLLYYKPTWTQQRGDAWRRASQQFETLSKAPNSSNRKFYIIDCEFNHPHCQSTTEPTIHEYRNGELVSTNVHVDAKPDSGEASLSHIEELKELIRQQGCNSQSACNPNPCLNGAVCIDGITRFSCQCRTGFTGPNCGAYGNFLDFTRTETLSDFMNVTWHVNFDTEKIIFEVQANTTGWVGFGISDNGNMTNADLIIGGVKDGNSTYFQDRFSSQHGLPSIDASQDWQLLDSNESSTHMYLKFNRSFDTKDALEDIKITDRDTYFIWAVGRTDSIQRHAYSGSKSVKLLELPSNFDRTERINENLTVTWHVDFKTKKVVFEVLANTTGYVGFGISKIECDSNADLIIGGVTPGGRSYFDDIHTDNNKKPHVDIEQNWDLLSAREENGQTYLKFVRDFDTGDSPDDLPITSEYFIYALGYSDDGTKFPEGPTEGHFRVNVLER